MRVVVLSVCHVSIFVLSYIASSVRHPQIHDVYRCRDIKSIYYVYIHTIFGIVLFFSNMII